MKHIKTYKIFEYSSEEVKDYLNDIFLDVQDEGFDLNVECPQEELTSYRVFIGDESTADFRARMNNNTKTFLLKDIYDNIQMAKSYMLHEGFFITEIRAISPRNADFFQVHGDRYGEFQVYGLLYSCNLYEQGKGELFQKPITFLELTFRKSK